MEDLKQFGTGCKKREWHPKNIHYNKLKTSAGYFDWNIGIDYSQGLIPNNQSASSSCVGQSVSKYLSVLKNKDLSARFIYSQIYLPEGGAYINDGFKIANTEGDVAKIIFSDDYSKDPNPNESIESFYRTKPDQTTISQATSNLQTGHAYVNLNIDDFALAIANQKGLVCGLNLSYEGFNQLGGFVRPPISGETISGHAIYCVGALLKNGKKYIRFINSWNGWGDNGFGYIGSDYFLSGNIYNAITFVSDIASFTHNFLINLSYGMTGQEVLYLQKALNLDGEYVPQTGNFYQLTKAAVIKFQQKYFLPATGFFGPLSRAKMNSLFWVYKSQ